MHPDTAAPARTLAFDQVFVRRLGRALVGVLIMTLARWLLNPLLGSQLPFFTYIIAIIYAAYLAGFVIGMIAATVSTLLALALFVGGSAIVHFGTAAHVPSLVAFMLVSVIVSVMGEIQVRSRDIAERALRLAQSERDEKERLLESIADAFIALDRSRRLVYANETAVALTGMERGKVLGRSLKECLPGAIADAVEARLNEAGLQSAASEIEVRYAEQGRWYSIKTCPSTTQGFSVFLRDVTAKRLDQEILQASEERFRVLAEAMPQFVWIFNCDGTFEYANRRWAEYTGQSQPMNWEELEAAIHLDDAGPLRERWVEATKSQTGCEAEYRCRRASDGSFRWFLARAVPVAGEAGGVARWITTSTDIHDHKEAEDQVRMLNASLHRAVYESSHRIKNHLQILAATVDMALMTDAETVPVGEVRRIGSHILTLSALQDILTLQWRSESDGVVDRVSTRRTLARLVDLLRQTYPAMRIDFEADDAPLPIRNATTLALICNEAAANAVKHGRTSAAVSFRAEGGTGRLEVRDDGPGFPDQFDPRRDGNTGMELMHSLGVCDLSGSVRLENAGDGGARVVVTFPLEECAAAGA